MTQVNFLTARWNNMISLGLGLLTLCYVLSVLASSTWSDKGEFMGLVIIGSML